MKKSINVASLNLDKPIYRVTVRPVVAYIIACLLGTVLIVWAIFSTPDINSLGLVIVGFAVIGRVIFLIVTVNDKILADLYADFILVYDPNDATKADKVDFTEIRDWEYKSGIGYGESLILQFTYNDPIIIESLKIRPVVKYLNKQIPAKRIRPKFAKYFKKKKK
ncbi:MAG: hypothetical protein WCI62_04220 [Erysipelotrichaceae bacterium]